MNTLLCVLSVAAVLFTKALGEPDIVHTNPTTHRIVDTSGRERYFHGTNVVVKGPPWIPRTDKFDPEWSFCEEDMQLMQSWGLNAIRYGVMWPGVEPTKGVYNETFISLTKDIINKAAQYGIYSILDMHQDVLSEKFCGEGIPDWAVNVGYDTDFPHPLDSPYKYDQKTGFPTPKDCAKHGWSAYSVAAATGAAYQALYNNSNGLTDKMAQFWGRIAQEFADNEYVIGYEVINEPWAGDIYANPELLIPTEADKINLAPFYEVLHTEIRKHDDKHSFYFTSVTFDVGGVGFKHVPGGAEYQNRSVLAWHFYVPPQISNTISFYERTKDIHKLGCAGFLTEFSLGVDDRLKTTLAEADSHFVSWTGWDYKPYLAITGSSNNFWSQNGTLNTELVKLVSRTYAQAVAGITTEMKFDPDSRVFTLKYTTTNSCSSNITEKQKGKSAWNQGYVSIEEWKLHSDTSQIYLNEKLHYQSGYGVTVEAGGKSNGVKWVSPKPNYIHVQHDTSLASGTSIVVTIKPKS